MPLTKVPKIKSYALIILGRIFICLESRVTIHVFQDLIFNERKWLKKGMKGQILNKNILRIHTTSIQVDTNDKTRSSSNKDT